MKLFCIPYAGGNEDVYNEWGEKLNCEVIPILLKGRKERIFMPSYKNLDEAVEDTYSQINMNKSMDEDYCIFGHSMGGLIAYEVYYRILERKEKLPKTLFISSVNVPGCKYTGKNFSKYEDRELVKLLFPLGGINLKIVENEQIAEFYLHILKQDMRLIEEYGTRKYDTGIESDLVIIYSKDDQLINKELIEKWNEEAISNFKIYDLDGGHFYILNNRNTLLDIIKSNLINLEVKNVK